MENILGTKLADRYLIEELVGVGGMCNVYRAFDAEALRTVAVKMLRDEYAADEDTCGASAMRAGPSMPFLTPISSKFMMWCWMYPTPTW
ncbi:MAG: hypothetical protein ACLTY5_11895 [Angelakisella sp.]